MARNVATEVRHTVLAADTAVAGKAPLERRTVVTAVGYAYERPDGVAVVPITSLGP